MHRLDLPRTYETIYVCGSFGLGGNREDDEEALRRMSELLEPGGLLVLDNEVPYSGPRHWQYWTGEKRAELPESWPESGDRRTGSDGTEYELRSRVVAIDPLSQQVTLGMQGFMWRDGRLIEEDEHELKMTLYFTQELKLMIERAGFSGVDLRADYTDEVPTGDTRFAVFIARKPEV